MNDDDVETTIETPTDARASAKARGYQPIHVRILPRHRRKLQQIMKLNRLDSLSQALRFLLDERAL